MRRWLLRLFRRTDEAMSPSYLRQLAQRADREGFEGVTWKRPFDRVRDYERPRWTAAQLKKRRA